MATARSIRLLRWSPRSMVKGEAGYTLPELMLALSILIFLMTVVFSLLLASQGAFNTADAGIQLRTILRNVSQKMSWELQHTGHDAVAGAQFTIMPGAGFNGSDVVRFSVPVACDATSNFLDPATSNPAHWGAYLTWGCDQASCADADGDCATVEYRYMQYELSSSGSILRKVLDPSYAVVATQSVADSISDLRFSPSPTTGVATGVTFLISGQKTSHSGLVITDGINQTVRFMN